MTDTAAFIGLGTMGYPMAGHLHMGGWDTTVFNRTRAKAEAWVEEYGGVAADTPARAARGAALVFTCVGTDDDLRAVCLGESGVLAGLEPGAILVDHSTVSATVARELAEAAAARGAGFLDAPVSGGQEGAQKGKLTVMVGGDPDTFAAAESALACYGRAVALMGPVGSGQLTKMVNQVCIAGTLQGLAEALAFACRAGLDGHEVVEVISSGAAQSWQMDNRAHTMLDDRFDFGFAVDWIHKDLGIVLDEARRNGAEMPVTALVEGFYARLRERGEGRLDSSALIRLLMPR